MRGIGPLGLAALLCAPGLLYAADRQAPPAAQVPGAAQGLKPIEQEEAPVAPPKAGANSFTEAQARDWIQKRGYTVNGNLLKDGNGVWHAQVTKSGGESLMVALDYQGKLTEEQPYTTHPTTPLKVAPAKDGAAQSGSTAAPGTAAPGTAAPAPATGGKTQP